MTLVVAEWSIGTHFQEEPCWPDAECTWQRGGHSQTSDDIRLRYWYCSTRDTARYGGCELYAIMVVMVIALDDFFELVTSELARVIAVKSTPIVITVNDECKLVCVTTAVNGLVFFFKWSLGEVLILSFFFVVCTLEFGCGRVFHVTGFRKW